MESFKVCPIQQSFNNIGPNFLCDALTPVWCVWYFPIVRSCPDLSPPRHGVLNCSERTTPYRLECLVRCEQGYRLQGRARLTCLANSQWSGPQPRCVGKIAALCVCVCVYIGINWLQIDGKTEKLQSSDLPLCSENRFMKRLQAVQAKAIIAALFDPMDHPQIKPVFFQTTVFPSENICNAPPIQLPQKLCALLLLKQRLSFQVLYILLQNLKCGTTDNCSSFSSSDNVEHRFNTSYSVKQNKWTLEGMLKEKVQLRSNSSISVSTERKTSNKTACEQCHLTLRLPQ